ncbi:DUF3872 domain-containing protein [Porphyromonas gulae]|uniref:Conjugal transfer protein n=1 Tax=Porphyromonas gulae TaxID=111105 RepID=A0A0A2FUE1_9PORP|nr:DUF3872 domain-containing protein [Porphyromonas gulae]KGN93685.1 conjugal transfer protein [Porphyromonas gulae]KGO04847.1 conjugal transfer protein [Porphyromonas gulae]
MKRNILRAMWVVGVLTFAGFCLPACNRELDVQQSYDFALQTMPVQKEIKKGETAEIRCLLKRAGNFADTRYTLRYFQPEGKGILKMDDGLVFKPNDRYLLTREEFRLYYTSQSADRQTIDVYIEDNFGKVQQLTFSFNNEKAE